MADLVKEETAEELTASPNSALIEVVHAMHKLTLEDKARLLEYLSRTLQYSIRQQKYRDISWEEFVDNTFGSLPDLTIEHIRPGYVDPGEED